MKQRLRIFAIGSLQFHPKCELLISRDQRIGPFLELRRVLSERDEGKHFLSDHPIGIGQPSRWSSDSLPSGYHVFGQGKASLRGHGAHGGAERNIGQ